MSHQSLAIAVLAALLPMGSARAAPSPTAPAPAARTWNGKVECRVELADTRTETQIWTLTGAAPTTAGIVSNYPATWTASGNGSGSRGEWALEVPAQPTVIAVFIRASDQRLIFRQGAPRAEVRGAVSLKARGSAMAASEWDFGWIDADAGATNVSGSRESSAAPLPGGLSVANRTPPMQCQWDLSKEAPTAAAPQIASNRPMFERPTDRGLTRATLTPAPMPLPADFTAQDMGGRNVRLSWSPVTGALGYHIEGTGVATGGIGMPGNQQGTIVSNVPGGPGNWTIAAKDSNQLHDPDNVAKASTIVRALPAHSPKFLTRPGSGNVGSALTHYFSACAQCVPGASLHDVLTGLGVTKQQLSMWHYDGLSELWQDRDEAEYRNLTEFHADRRSRCWPHPQLLGYVVCWAQSSDHGLTVLARKPPHTWFFAFEGSPTATLFHPSQRLTASAVFDGEGQKFAPHACLSCHGGTFNPSNGLVTGATLLPIDPVRITAKNDKFHLINKAIIDTAPPPSVMRFLDGIYGGNARTSSTADPDFVPTGWSANADLYRKVVRPYCIACHLNTPNGLDFSTEGGFQNHKVLILTAVCGTHSMPHSEYQFKDFWTKDTGNIYLPGYLAAALGGGECH
jgi:hypothetical protein